MLTRQDLITHNVVLTHGDVEAKRAEIKRYFNLTYDAYESLFTCLKGDEAYYQRPCSLRHPLIFYFGHTATFFTNKLVLAKLLPERINPAIESMCAIGVDEMSWDDLNDAHYDWPSVEALREYRNQVRAAVNHLIDTVEFRLPIDWQSPLWPVMMGIEHERIHLETSSVLIRQLDLRFVQSSNLFPICPDQSEPAPENTLLDVASGQVTIDHQDPAVYYGWDNEYGKHQASVTGFQASKYLVSNAEFLAFVEDGGYENPVFWDEEGDRWRQFSPVKHPSFWVKKEEGWFLRCMTEEILMPWSWPVDVNFLEADAFCRWKAKKTGLPIRLPSEDEYLRLRDATSALDFHNQANHNLQLFASSVPVNRCEMNGFFDVIGNVWQWTQTPIHPFDGFKVHPLYDDFTTPTFDNKHAIIKGGSWISTGNEINGFSRYAFRRHFFQHAGFRYMASDAPVQTVYSTYETDLEVARACEAHYGKPRLEQSSVYESQLAQRVMDAVQADPNLRERAELNGLVIGCSVGRSSFELARYFTQVIGLDFSARFINAANRLQTTGSVLYTMPMQGEVMAFEERSLAQYGLDNTKARCSFMQQDPCNMKPHFTGYDVILVNGQLERVYEPKKLVLDLAHRLNSAGLLVIASSYDWSEDYSTKSAWLGGYKDSQTGENVDTLDALQELLSNAFVLQDASVELARVVPRNSRCLEQELMQVSVWKKRT